MTYWRVVLPLFLFGVLVAGGCDSSGDSLDDGDPEIRLAAQLRLIDANELAGVSDVWGYVDAATGAEYALVGAINPAQESQALFIVEASDPRNPALVATVAVPGFDIKVWRNYAYTVTGGPDRGAQPEGRIIDLSDPANPQIVGAFPSAHNLFIDDRGFMYLEFPGLRIFDLNVDPLNPQLVWNDQPQQGHDAAVIGDRLYDFHGTDGTFIYDVSNRAAPVRLGLIRAPDIRYHHSGWPTEDERFLFICDELAGPLNNDITVWDISAPADPVRVAALADTSATVHNLYIRDELAFVSYYSAGFRLYDVSDPTAPRLVDEYDTAPEVSGLGFDGAWGVYPFTPSGAIYVSDRTNGLFIFQLE